MYSTVLYIFILDGLVFPRLEVDSKVQAQQPRN